MPPITNSTGAGNGRPGADNRRQTTDRQQRSGGGSPHRAMANFLHPRPLWWALAVAALLLALLPGAFSTEPASAQSDLNNFGVKVDRVPGTVVEGSGKEPPITMYYSRHVAISITPRLTIAIAETGDGNHLDDRVERPEGLTLPSGLTLLEGTIGRIITANRIIDDAVDEPNSQITLTILPDPNDPPRYGLIDGRESATVTAIDNDPTVVELERASGNTGGIDEGGVKALEFTITLGRKLVASERIDVPLKFSGSGITAGDFELLKKPGDSLNTGGNYTCRQHPHAHHQVRG